MIDTSRYAVRETIVVTGIGTAVLAKNNPTRIYLGFACSSGGAMRASTKPNTPNGSGILIPNTGELVEFWWNKHGSMVSGDWFAVNGALGNITVFEVYELPEGPS